MPLQNYFEQQDRGTSITVLRNVVEIYNVQNYNRKVHNKKAFKLMEQVWNKLV